MNRTSGGEVVLSFVVVIVIVVLGKKREEERGLGSRIKVKSIYIYIIWVGSEKYVLYKYYSTYIHG